MRSAAKEIGCEKIRTQMLQYNFSLSRCLSSTLEESRTFFWSPKKEKIIKRQCQPRSQSPPTTTNHAHHPTAHHTQHNIIMYQEKQPKASRRGGDLSPSPCLGARCSGALLTFPKAQPLFALVRNVRAKQKQKRRPRHASGRTSSHGDPACLMEESGDAPVPPS